MRSLFITVQLKTLLLLVVATSGMSVSCDDSSFHFSIVGRGTLTSKKLKFNNKQIAFKQCRKCCDTEAGSNQKPNCLCESCFC